MDENLREKIHEANIAVHRFEAKYYELIHPEVYSWHEQQRIRSVLSKVDSLIEDDRKNALDFGAGTGNLTEKLLRMGYTVTAVDISAEMCAILRKRFKSYISVEKLFVVNSPMEDVAFERNEFSLITCYSVLHHLPDYEGALQRLAGFLGKGGVIYIDHEASPFYWTSEPSLLGNLIKFLYFHSNPMLNSLYFRLVGLNAPSIDYTLSDYWHKKEHPLDHCLIERVFRSSGFDFYKRADYFLKGTWIPNPFFYFYKKFCTPEMSYWIAKK